MTTLERLSAATRALDSGSPAAMREALLSFASAPESERGPAMHVSIARSFTIETQLDAIELALSAIPCRPQIRVGDFGVIEQALLSPASELLDPQPDAVLVLWRIEDLFPGFAAGADRLDRAERERACDELVARVDRLCGGFRAHSTAPLFLSTFCTPRAAPLHDATLPYGLRDVTLRLNEAILRNARASEGVFVLDVAAWAERFGSRAFDPKMDLYARAPIARAALPSFARFLARTLAPLVRPPAKLLAVDLDNVLWGGILGESGPDELKIGQDYPGNVYWRIQERLLALRARGIMLALVSKNNEPDVVAAFEARPWMPLKLADFTAQRVNWLPKHENLRSIAAELNIGTDAIVFLDDQPFERGDVAFYLPDVRLLGESADPLALLTALEETDVFDTLRLTGADRMRVADYAAQVQRQLPTGGSDARSFLHSLELRATLEPLGEGNLARAVQMLQKTNQFNVTTRRHTEAQVRAFLAEASTLAFTVSLRDKFGDQGIIGLAVVSAGALPEIDTFLLSCRAIGRGVEELMWAAILTHLNAQGATALAAKYIPTAKNAQVRDLYDRLGMACTNETGGVREYRLTLPLTPHYPDWIQCDTI